ncbi:MAG: hypothetical protein JNL80_08585 [Phycisphaerae bacterium]|jgi:hypothetical protein|nr:hypothetical protein [Phycisphaerae bacterium]
MSRATSRLKTLTVTRTTLALGAVAIANAICHAGVNYDVTIVTSQSSIDSTTNLSVPLTGTLIGNWNARTNPTGTKTIPGLFGGSGNNPIGYSATFVADGSFSTVPSGTFQMNVDTGSLSFTLDGLTLDFLSGETAGVDATLNVNYSSFHTQNPTAIFPGGVTIPLPLGEALLTELSASQTGAAVAGILVPSGPDSFTFATAVPVDLLATIEANGQVFGGTPVPFALPIAGTVTFGGESVVITLNGTNTIEETQAIDPPATFENQAIDLPTVLPPGGTAHILFGGSIASLSVTQSLTFDIVADAAAQLEPGDLNGDGSVSAPDLAILLGAWGSSGPGDLNGDGTVGAADLALLLGAWS